MDRKPITGRIHIHPNKSKIGFVLNVKWISGCDMDGGTGIHEQQSTLLEEVVITVNIEYVMTVLN